MNAAISMLVFGVYYLVAGLGYLVLPAFILNRLDVGAAGDIWVRFAGLLLVVLSYFYIQAGRYRFVPLFRWSAHARVITFLVFVLLWLMGLAEGIVLIFAVVEIAGAAWTWFTLPHE